MQFHLRALADSVSYPAAGLGILIESSGVPFPGEATLLAVAAYAAAGHLDIRVVVVLGLRTWASVLAGMSRMPFWTFQLYSSAGALIWALAVGAVGFYLGTNWALVQGLIRALGMGGLVVAAILILAALLLRRRVSHI
jgi:membrane protein DedA with SNARE-associated domain